jgi:TM2 domain-containing membrane protein YozV
MGKIDKEKEHISNIRIYLGFIIVILISISTGVSKLYLSKTLNELFYIGIIWIIIFTFIFAILSKHLHKKTNELEEID